MTKFFENHTVSALILGAVLLVASFLVLNWTFRPTMERFEWKEKDYRVQAGDSLWAIASEYCPDGVDRREWISEVKALNDIDDSIIHPGQRITVLVAKEG